MLTYYENLLIFCQMPRSSRRSGCSYRERQPTRSSGTPAVTEEVEEVLDLPEVEEVAAAPEGRPRPLNLLITLDRMPRPRARLEEIGTWTDASSGNRRREIKVDTAILSDRRATCLCPN